MASRRPIGDVSAAQDMVLVTPGTPFAPCRFLLVGAGGLADITVNEVVKTGVPLQAGYNPISATLVAIGAAATNIWACY